MHNPNLNLEFNESAFEAGTLSRDEHLWHSQRRALASLQVPNNSDGAFTSMMLDLSKHPELQKHSGIGLGMMLQQARLLNNDIQLKRWITGFN